MSSCGCDTTQKWDLVSVPEWNTTHIYGVGEVAKYNSSLFVSKGSNEVATIQAFTEMRPMPSFNGLFGGLPPQIPHTEVREVKTGSANLGIVPEVDIELMKTVNSVHWERVPENQCFDSFKCTPPPPPQPLATPAPISSEIQSPLHLATGDSQNVIPASAPSQIDPSTSSSLLTPGPTTENMDDYDSDEDEEGPSHSMPDGSTMKGTLFQAHIAGKVQGIADSINNLQHNWQNFELQDIETKHYILAIATVLTGILLFKK
jgi:hypothetical protein